MLSSNLNCLGKIIFIGFLSVEIKPDKENITIPIKSTILKVVHKLNKLEINSDNEFFVFVFVGV